MEPRANEQASVLSCAGPNGLHAHDDSTTAEAVAAITRIADSNFGRFNAIQH